MATAHAVLTKIASIVTDADLYRLSPPSNIGIPPVSVGLAVPELVHELIPSFHESMLDPVNEN